MTPFRRRVLTAVADLPRGVVVTYGELANEVGNPGAARAVGNALRDVGDGVPWWRVVPASGRLVAHLAARQSALLRAEGVAVDDDRILSVAASTGTTADSYRDALPAGEECPPPGEECPPPGKECPPPGKE